MKFDMRLQSRNQLTLQQRKSVRDDPVLDNAISVIQDIGEQFHESGAILFQVGGFGQAGGRCDCLFDLPVIIEQIPVLLDQIEQEEFQSVLDFSEQGIERAVIFEHSQEQVRLTCWSKRADWSPSPAQVMMETEQLYKMLWKLNADFVDLAEQLCPELIQHSWLRYLKKWTAKKQIASLCKSYLF